MGQVETVHRPQDIGLKTPSPPHTFSVLGCGTGMVHTRKGTLPRPHHYPRRTTRLSLCLPLPHQVLRRQTVGRGLHRHRSPPSRGSSLGSHHTWWLLPLKSGRSGIDQVRGHILKAGVPNTGQPKVHPRELPVGGSIGDEKRGVLFHPTQLRPSAPREGN